MNNIVYIIDYLRLVIWCLPFALRQPKTIAYLQSLIQPMINLYNEFIDYKVISLYKMNHNSQVCYLRAVLNDSFDFHLRRIIIQNARILEPNWLYHPADNKPKFIYSEADNSPQYLYDPNSFIGDGVDFVVIVPLVLKPSTQLEIIRFETKMKGLLDYYKLYSKNYSIKYE
ncbi:MAG: hypothetical protein COB73_00700 [Flavobacteriaceae bacterium]|nr:MAG: hypothetical protein COB73_00700 [Flavobacteriaceae bacterium]